MTKLLLTQISEMLTLQPAMQKEGRKVQEADLGITTQQAVYVENGRIAWMGPHKKIPKELSKQKKLKEISLKGKTVLPGFVECHTHLVFAGDRAAEFEMRNQGVSYQEIAQKGGGILSSVKHTRAASPKVLRDLAQERVNEFISQGVTTLEIKSGYGLDEKNEFKSLKVAKSLEGLRVVPTFLGAHAKAPEYSSYREYLQYLASKVLPALKKQKLAKRVDIFIEKGFFEKDDAREFLTTAKNLGFEITIHADQLTLSGGADLGVELGAVSGDHLIQIQEPQIRKLAASSVTCVLLPAADLYMKCAYPPARALIDAGARVALATDFNPGTSPTQDLNLVGLLARLEMKMSLPEVIGAYTVGAAHALNLQAEVGSLAVGKSADIICTDVSWQQMFYSVGKHLPTAVFHRGSLVY